MAAAPVQLDMSTLQTDQPAQSGPVQLDMSTFQMDHSPAPEQPGIMSHIRGAVSALGEDIGGFVKAAPSMLGAMVGPTPVPVGGGQIAVSNPGGEQIADTMASDAKRAQEGRSPAYRAAAAAGQNLGMNVPASEQAAEEGRPGASVGHLLAPLATAGLAKGVESYIHPAVRGVVDHIADSLTTQSARAAMPAETANLPIKAVAGSEKVFQAAAPVGTNTRFRSNVYAAAGDLAEVGRAVDQKLNAAKGGIIQPDMRDRATVQAINDHLSDMYNTERAPQIANHANAPLTLDVNPDAMAGITQMARAGKADVAKLAIKARAGQLTLQEADQLARGVNSELRKYEAMTPEAQAAAQVNTKALNGLKVLDRELSERIDDQLRIDGQPGIREYERRYAGLSAIRDQLRVRMNSAELQHPGVVKAAGQAVGLFGKKPLAGASQASVADVRLGRALQQGLKKLSDSGIKANRAVPRTPAPLELTPPPGRVPPASQEHLPFNEGHTQDMQTGPNGPLNLTGQGRVPPATQDDLNFNGADQEPEAKPPQGSNNKGPDRRGGGNSGPRKDLLSDEQRARVRAMLENTRKALTPNPHVPNPFDRNPDFSDMIRAKGTGSQ